MTDLPTSVPTCLLLLLKPRRRRISAAALRGCRAAQSTCRMLGWLPPSPTRSGGAPILLQTPVLAVGPSLRLLMGRASPAHQRRRPRPHISRPSLTSRSSAWAVRHPLWGSLRSSAPTAGPLARRCRLPLRLLPPTCCLCERPRSHLPPPRQIGFPRMAACWHFAAPLTALLRWCGSIVAARRWRSSPPYHNPGPPRPP